MAGDAGAPAARGGSDDEWLWGSWQRKGSGAQEQPCDEWLLTSFSPTEPYRPTLANGCIGTVVGGVGTGGAEAGTERECSGNHFMQGVWTGAPGKEWLAKIPVWDAVVFNNGTSDAEISQGKIENYRQTLDQQSGFIETTYDWTESGKTTSVDIRIFVSRRDPNLAAIRYTAVPHFDGPAAFKITFDGQKFAHLAGTERGGAGNALWLETEVAGTKTIVAEAAVTSFDGAKPALEVWKPDTETKRIAQLARFTAKRDQTYRVDAVVAICQSRESKEPLAEAKRKAAEGAKKGFDELFAEHSEAWHELWKTDIIVDGPAPEVAFVRQHIHADLFALLQSVRPGAANSFNSMGFSRDGWCGGVFWDAEIWMYPAILVTHPEMAESILRYRLQTLPGAKENAAADGLKGAEYPWLSGYSGREDAIKPYEKERHISGDIALAFWSYYLFTHDKQWLAKDAWPVIRESARYMVSRAVARNGRYEVLDVIPPDEDAGVVNNSTFTNAVFKESLEIAIKAAKLVGQEPDKEWAPVANGLWIPFDETNQRYIGYEGYPVGRRIKQADPEMLIYPLEWPMSEAVKRNTLNYYVDHISPTGPAMTRAIHSIGYAELGDRAAAYANYKDGYERCIRGPFLVMSETAQNNSVDVMTCRGDNLLPVIHGFAGMRIREDGVHFLPCLPDGWSTIRMTHLKIGGAIYDVTPGRDDSVKCSLVSGIPDVAVFDKAGKRLFGAR